MTVSAIRKTTAAQTATRPSNKTMSIGVVIERLRDEFPDVTVSKLRFLESEGLITPQRTQSGYRRFTDADVDRLRFILVTQRDNYLPLKVIREQLEAMDAGEVPAIHTVNLATVESAGGSGSAASTERLSDADLAVRAAVEESFIAELIEAELIVPDASGLFTSDDVAVVSAAAGLREHGVDARYLKTVRQAASRQASFITQVTDPIAKSRKANAKAEAAELSQNLSNLVANLHVGVMKNELRRHLG